MSNAGKLVKDMLKAKKESVMGKLGDSPYEDPMEPWSAKYAQPVKEESLNEDSLLIKYIKSLGFNPEFMSFAQRSSYARSNAFKTYKTGHTFDAKKQNLKTEETEQIDEAGTGLLMSFIKSKGLNPLTMDGNQKKAYARSSEFRIFKMRHVKETSGMGERGDDWNEQEDKGIRQWDKPNFALSIKARQAKADKAKELQANTDNMQKKGIKPKNMKEEADVKDAGEYDYEGAMAKTLLQTICRNAEALKDMLEDDENLPEWVQSKITKAEDYITTSLDYMKSTEELDEEVEQIEELSTKTLDSYITKVATGPSRGMTQKGTLKSIKAIGGVTTALRKKAEKPITELKNQDEYGPAATAALRNKSPAYHVAAMDRKDRENKLNVDRDRALAQQKVSRGEDPTLTHAGNAALKAQQQDRLKKQRLNSEEVEQIDELKNQDDNQELDSHITREDLRKWFSKTDPEGDWKRINSKGDAVGPCAREPGEPKPKCMSKEKRAELSKSERAAAVATKRKHDPVADRAGKGGKPVNVSNYGKGKLSEDEVDEACWDNHKKVGMKMKGGKMVPDCRPKNEEVEQIDEKNKPTNPALWSRAKSMARSKFDVYPSAYANGWASKWYKSKGGGWKSVSEDTVQEGIGGIEDSPMSATNSVKAMESEQRKKNMKSARIIKSIYKKKGKNESMYDWEKDDKPNAKITLQGGTTMTGKPRDTVEIEPVIKTRPNSQKQ